MANDFLISIDNQVQYEHHCFHIPAFLLSVKMSNLKKQNSLLLPTRANAGSFCPHVFFMMASQSSKLSKLCAFVMS